MEIDRISYSKKLKERLRDTIANLSKSLSLGDLNSLKNSAKMFSDFGPEAEAFMTKIHLPDSALDRFVRELIHMGMPFKMVREAATRKLFLLLSIQHNWHNGLGKILVNTTFYKTKYHAGKMELFSLDNPSKTIEYSDIPPKKQRYIDRILMYDHVNKFKLISITTTESFSIVCAFEKKKKVYKVIYSIFDDFDQKEQSETKDCRVKIEPPIKPKPTNPFPMDIASILNFPRPEYLNH